MILPTIFNDDNNVDAPETNKLVKFVLFNNVVDVLFKLLIDKVELVDKLFKLVNIVFDVVVKLLIDNIDDVDKLLIDNIEFVDKLFKFVFVAYTVKSGLFVIAL